MEKKNEWSDWLRSNALELLTLFLVLLLVSNTYFPSTPATQAETQGASTTLPTEEVQKDASLEGAPEELATVTTEEAAAPK